MSTFILSVPWKMVGGLALTTTVGIITWEHVAKKKGSNKRPSIGLTKASEFSQGMFVVCGVKFAQLSSYLTKIDLKYLREIMGEIWQSTKDVLGPTCGILVSPFYLISGYCDTAIQYGKKRQLLIYAGSIFIAVGLFCGWYFLGRNIPAEGWASMLKMMNKYFSNN